MLARRPTPRDLPAIALGVNLALLFGAALWLRLTSLEALPEPNGDEAWYGVQAEHLIHGKAFATRTPNGNPLNPFHVGTEALLLLAFRPSFWVLRISSAAAGIGAVALTYRLGSRMLDRTTATIAAAILAALPIAILFSRLGYDCSMTPLFSVLALYWASQAQGARMALGFALCLVAHPSNVFLLPALLAAYLPRAWAVRPATRRIVATAATMTLMAAGLAFYQRRLTREFLKIRKYDLVLFAKRFANLLVAGDSDDNPAQINAVLAILGIVAIAGAWRLGRGRNWDRLAMLAGVILSALASFAAVGSDTLRPIEQRDGLFLVVPTAFAAACAIRSLIAERPALRIVQVGSLLVGGWALLGCFAANHCREGGPPLCFGLWRADPLPTRSAFRADSPWTFGTDRADPKAVAARVIARDLDRLPGGGEEGALILAQDWWTHRPLQYLCSRRPGLRAVDYSTLPAEDLGATKRRFRGLLASGAYVVCYSGQFLERFAEDEFPASRLRRWEIGAYGGPYLTVLRLRDGREGVALRR